MQAAVIRNRMRPKARGRGRGAADIRVWFRLCRRSFEL